MAAALADHPWLARHSSPIDWCEANYVVAPHIAEFYNTVSNVLFVVLGVRGMVLARRCALPARAVALYACLILIGLASAYFHATLSFFGQFLDEFAIMVAFLVAITRYVPAAAAAALGVVLAALMLAVPLAAAPALILCGSGTARILYLGNARTSNVAAKTLYRRTIVLWIAAVCVWVLDRVACDWVAPLYLHAVWHLLVLFVAHSAITLGFLFDGEQQSFRTALLPIFGGSLHFATWHSAHSS